MENGLYPASLLPSPHPCWLELEKFLDQCVLRAQRRSGPGGQHRNKTSSGIFLEHKPTGHIGEATERRSQADNRGVACQRLRIKLATVVRVPSPLVVRDGNATWKCVDESEAVVRSKYESSPLKVAPKNFDHASLMACLMNDLWRAGGQPSLVAAIWKVSTSALVRFVRLHPPAFVMVNAYRQHHGRASLR